MVILHDYTIISKFFGYLSKKIAKIFSIESYRGILSIRIILNVVIFGFIGFGIPFIIGVITGDDTLLKSLEVKLLFLWLLIGGLLIYALEYSIDDFWDGFKKISKLKGEEFEQLKNKYNKMYFSWKISGSISIIAWILAFFAASNEWQYDHSAIVITMIRILLIFPSIMWGVIILITFYTYYFVWKICKTDIYVDPYAPDGNGGLFVIAKLPIRVAFVLSSFSLYIPYSITRKFIIGEGTQIWWINIIWQYGIFFVIGMMICTYFLPLIPVYNLAKKNKNSHLEKHGSELKEIIYSKDKPQSITDPQILILFEHYKTIQKMREWPFNAEMLLKFMGTILIPITIGVATFLLK